MDYKNPVFFADALELFKQFTKVLQDIGADKFYSSPDEGVKRAREAMAEFFFVAALKKGTGLDWYVMQPEDRFPDFCMMSVIEKPIAITIAQFELVEIKEDRCPTFEHMLQEVQKKLKKGYPNGFSLLIFVNHTESVSWIKKLADVLEDYKPFNEIWTVNLLFNNPNEMYGATISKLRPKPAIQTTATIDASLVQQSALPFFMEEVTIDGKKCRGFKQDFMAELRKSMLRSRLGKKKND